MTEIGDSSEVWDDSYGSYLQLGDLIAAVAESHHGIQIDDTTRNRWRELMGLLREVDTKVDGNPDSQQQVLDLLGDFGRFEQRYPHLTPEALGPEIHQRLGRDTALIFDLGNHVNRTRTGKYYVYHRRMEGRMTAQLFIDSATGDVSSQPGFAGFGDSIRQFGETSALADSFVDIRQDHKTGQTELEPSVGLRLRLLGSIAFGAAKIAPVIAHKPVIRQMQKAFLVSMRRHFNRSR